MIVGVQKREVEFIRGARDAHPILMSAYCILRYVLDLPLVIFVHLLILFPMVGYAAFKEFMDWCKSLFGEISGEVCAIWRCAKFPFKKRERTIAE